MSKKIAVCEGYATLFSQLCTELNIKSKIVTGSAKTKTSDIGKRFNASHAWNIVEIDNKKYLIDATWGVDKTKNNGIDYKYFLTLPKYFILKHYPNNYKDALLDKPISKEKYLNNPLYYGYYFDVISPKLGTLIKSKSKLVKFVFKSKKKISNVSISVKKQFLDIDIVKNDDTLEFEVDLSKHPSAKELIIFFDNKAAIAYKLKN